MIDHDFYYKQTLSKLAYTDAEFREPPLIRLWDGNWRLLDQIVGAYSYRFKFLANDAGDAEIRVPVDHYAAEVLRDPDAWPTKSLYLTFDKDGTRWSGRIENVTVTTDPTGFEYVDVTAVHDYVKLKELLCWANPFLPAGVQFPKAWMLYGPTRWVLATTLMANLRRKHKSGWRFPRDPVRRGSWNGSEFLDWSMVVKPVDIGSDNTLPATLVSRFKTFHDAAKDIADDAQVSIEVRRYLDGDAQPIPGVTLRHGCAVVDIVDKSGRNGQTSFGGSMIGGLIRAFLRVGGDGLTETVQTVPRVNQPAEYYQQGFRGTVPEAPWVVLEDGPFTTMESAELSYTPPGPVQFVTGGSSMPGINEAIKAAIVGFGGFLGSLFFGQSQLGAVADAVLEPLYSDVFLAFMTQREGSRAAAHGWDAPFEYWVDGADKAYTIAAISSMRKAREQTREKYSATVKLHNGSPYFIGSAGFGDFFINDRVAVHAKGMPENKLFVAQVSELEYSADASDAGWDAVIGTREFDSGWKWMSKRLERVRSGLRELGVW